MVEFGSATYQNRSLCTPGSFFFVGNTVSDFIALFHFARIITTAVLFTVAAFELVVYLKFSIDVNHSSLV